MKDYYTTLGISRETNPAEVKKAYFSLVRKFPPDRYPEEFMKIREAYEILSDANTRRQYDLVDSMPDIVKMCFTEGQKLLEEGDFQQAIALLERVIGAYPDFSMVEGLLGEAYLKNENSGKAIQIFEALVEKEPHNAGFAGKLAHAYRLRGWHKKAVQKYHGALVIDEDNIAFWLGLIDCYLAARDFVKVKETIRRGIAVSRQKGWDNLELYYHLILSDAFGGDISGLREHLQEMKEIAARKETEKGNTAWFLASLARDLHSRRFFKEAAAAIDTAFELLPGDSEIEGFKTEIDQQSRLMSQLEEVGNDRSFHPLFAAMLEFELQKCRRKNCLDCEFTQFTFEMDFLLERDNYNLKKDLLRLKNAYPELYRLKKGFFDNLLLNWNKEEFLVTPYLKKYEKYRRLFPEQMETAGDEEEIAVSQPYQRPGPKIGRNDPCPCGSGKKYKKCCLNKE